MQFGDTIMLNPNQAITVGNTWVKVARATQAGRRAVAFQGQGDDNYYIAYTQKDVDADNGWLFPANQFVAYDNFFPGNDIWVKSAGADIKFLIGINEVFDN